MFVLALYNTITVITIAVVVPCLTVVVIVCVVVIAVLVYCYKVKKNRYKQTYSDFSKIAQLSQYKLASLLCIESVYLREILNKSGYLATTSTLYMHFTRTYFIFRRVYVLLMLMLLSFFYMSPLLFDNGWTHRIILLR